MSYVRAHRLKGLRDPSLSFFTITLAFTTAQLVIDALTQYGSYIYAFRIVNQDGTNVCQYRQGSPSTPLKTIPINTSEESDPAWESYLEIDPNAVSGVGYVELNLVQRQLAELAQNPSQGMS